MPVEMQADELTTLLAEQLGDRATRDPLAALLLQKITRQAEAVEDTDLTDQRLQRAARTIARLRAEVAAANRMATEVARVLGACGACWGLARACPQCHGQGGPGSQEPDAAVLMAWIGPALQRAGITPSPTRPAQ